MRRTRSRPGRYATLTVDGVVLDVAGRRQVGPNIFKEREAAAGTHDAHPLTRPARQVRRRTEHERISSEESEPGRDAGCQDPR